MKHLIDKACSCKYCTMIDIMWGDPALSKWGRGFIKSVARWGWEFNYSPAQKKKIIEVFKEQLKKYWIPMFSGGMEPMN